MRVNFFYRYVNKDYDFFFDGIYKVENILYEINIWIKVVNVLEKKMVNDILF